MEESIVSLLIQIGHQPNLIPSLTRSQLVSIYGFQGPYDTGPKFAAWLSRNLVLSYCYFNLGGIPTVAAASARAAAAERTVQ